MQVTALVDKSFCFSTTSFDNERFCSLSTFFLLFFLDSFDYLRITDGSSNTIGTYCGNQTGKSERVFGTVAVLTFHTDGSVQRRGFELSFSFFSHSLGKLTTVSIVFTTLIYF